MSLCYYAQPLGLGNWSLEGSCALQLQGSKLFGQGSIISEPCSIQGVLLQTQFDSDEKSSQLSSAMEQWPTALVCPNLVSLQVGEDVASELRAMGVSVARSAADLQRLPPPPPEPTTTNLDTTTLCALVSEVRPPPQPCVL